MRELENKMNTKEEEQTTQGRVSLNLEKKTQFS
jgi:hypothetical protein